MLTKKRAWMSGVVSMALGTAVVFGTVLLINNYADRPLNEDLIKTTAIDFQKKEKPEPKKVVKKKQPPKKRSNRTPPAPLVGLNSTLDGLDLGLPEFEVDDLSGLTNSLLGDSDDVVMTDDAVDNAPRPVTQTPMAYPARAKAKGIQGYVVMTLLISPTGDVERVKLLESSPAGLFDDVAITGVRNWKFEPATYQGESVRVWAKQRVSFELG